MFRVMKREIKGNCQEKKNLFGRRIVFFEEGNGEGIINRVGQSASKDTNHST